MHQRRQTWTSKASVVVYRTLLLWMVLSAKQGFLPYDIPLLQEALHRSLDSIIEQA